MNYFLFYQSIESTESDQDAFSIPPNFEIPFRHKDHTIQIAFYFSTDNRFLGIRVKLTGFQPPNLTSEQFIAMQQASEYAITLLRLRYSAFTLFKAPYSPGIGCDDEDCPVKLFIPNTVPHEPNFKPVMLKDFADSLAHIQDDVDDDLWLLGNSYNRRLPAIYRYLSLTKIFEKYQSDKKGSTFSVVKIAPFFEKYNKEYQSLKTELKLSHPKGEFFALDLRGKVAHRAYQGNNYEVSSIHGHFSYEVEQFTEQIAQRVAIDVLNSILSVLPDPHPIITWMSKPRFL